MGHSEHLPRAMTGPASWSARLSTEQLRFYFLHELDPSDPDIHICRTLRIAGALDHGRLRASVLDLARRHDILRSYYPEVDGLPRIALRDDVDAACAVIDLSPLAAPERAARADELISSELGIRQPFRIDEGPLFRVTAIQLGDLEHVLVLRFHHILVDGTSVRLFLDGLWEAYAGLAQGTRLARPAHQFRDYVEWEARRLADPARAEDRAYWARKLARPAVLDLTLGGGRPARHTGEADTVHALAGPRWMASLRALCKALRVTPYVVMMSVFQILLHRITGERDVLVGTPIACRQRVEHQPMLGVLLNWIAFRSQLEPGMAFRNLLAQVRDELPEAYLRQCSYEALLSAAGSIPRDPARNPLLQVTLNYATYRELPAPPGLTIELDPIVSPRTRYDLSVRFEEIGDSLSLGLTYYRGAMARGAAEELAAALLALAEQYTEHPDHTVADARLGDRLSATPLEPATPQRAPAPASPPRRVVIAATFTAEPIQPALGYWLDQVGLRSEIEFAPLDQVFQALLPPDGLVAGNRLGTSVLLVRLEDWKDPAAATGELCRLLAAHAERTAADTIVVVCPPRAATRGRARAAELERLARLEREIAAVAEPSTRLHFLSWRTILSRYPVDVIDDPDSDAYAQAPYSEDFHVALGTAIARKIHAVVRPGPKVLLLDCDNTLWRGVVGEDGADGLEIDPGRRELQQLAIDRLGAGVLLGLVSKNNEADVWEAFERAPGMLLRREMIVAHRIDWEPKSRNIESLAAELNLGVDSFVFLDDSPAECAEVRAGCPGVLVLQLPTEPEAISRFLQHLWPLDARKATDTDRKRAALYAANARRERLRSATSDLHQFVASLEVRTTFVPLSSQTAARAAQLTQRTNQFNTTTIRRSEAELRAIADGGAELLIADVSDRFGDYGIVGVVVHRRGPGALEVDTLLLSCRALGRGVEQRILAELGRIAADRGLARVEIAYRRTAKNRPALQFLEAIAGRHRVETGTDGHHVYRIPVAEALAAADRLVTAEVAAEDAAPASPGPVEPAVSHDLWRRIATELDSIPRIRAQLAASLGRARSAGTAYVAPRGELERAIARAWSEVLLVEPIGATDDYFAIGGDSIRSLAVVSRLRRAGLPVAVLDLHEHPTVARLAELIRARTPGDLAPAPPSAAPAAPAAEAAEAAGEGPYPLSFSQEYVVRVYARENLAPRGAPSGAFHIQDRLIIRERRGRPSMEALRRAAERLVRRTSILRTRIFRDGERLMQAEIAASPAFDVVDLSGLPDREQEDRIDRLLRDDRTRPFDPEQSGSPMIRFHAIVRSAERFELVVTAHHGFCDGWSMQGFYGRLLSLYEAHRDGDGARVAEIDRALAAHERAFRELVHHEQRALGSAETGAFWRAYLPDRLEVPAARRTAPVGPQPQLVARGDWQLVARARARARSSGTSLKAVLLEAFAAALARRSSPPSPLVIAVVTNGRKDDLTTPMEVFGLCWTFVPIVPTGSLGSGPGDRRARLAGIHRDLIATEAHARYPIEGMFGGLAPEEVARASFNLTNFHNASWRHGTEDLEISQAESFHRFHFPLNLNIRLVERARSVVLKASWSTDAFDQGLVRGLLEDFPAELGLPGSRLEIE